MIQRYEPPPVQLINLTSITVPSTPPQTIVAPFRIPTPDSRLNVAVTILFRQDINNKFAATPVSMPFDATRGGDLAWSLFLVGRDRDPNNAGAMVPTVELFATKTAPQTIPSDVSIDGYADDFEGGQDEIYGELTVVAGGLDGTLRGIAASLFVVYEPGTVAICDEEWRQIVSSGLSPQGPTKQLGYL